MTAPTLRPATRLVHGGTTRSPFGETAEALFLTSGFVYDDAEQAEATFAGTVSHYQYSRFGNPTVTMLEERLAGIEGAEACRATATGMAAVHAALLSHLKTGDRVVASRALFGSCHWIVSTLLPRYGIETEFVDGTDLARLGRAPCPARADGAAGEPVQPDAGNARPAARSAAWRTQAGAIVVVDNVFATPLLQKPLELGADVVVYSCTKHIDGQGRVLGGAVLGRKAWIEETLQPFIRNTGPSMSPFNAWLLLKGLETLALRVEAACASAAPGRRLPGRAPGGPPGLYPAPRRPSAARAGHAADERRRHAGHVRAAPARRRRSRLMNALPADRGVQQSGRLQVARHASGDHHAYAHRRRGARPPRHHRRRRSACRSGSKTRPT